MKLVSIENYPGKEFEVLGIVKGTIVQSKNVGRDIMAGLKTLVGGEIAGYTEMLNEARQIATKRMVDEAEALGADIVGESLPLAANDTASCLRFPLPLLTGTPRNAPLLNY